MARYISWKLLNFFVLGDEGKIFMPLLTKEVHYIINAYDSVVITPHITIAIGFISGWTFTRPLIEQLPLIKTLKGCENEKPLIVVSEVMPW